MNINLGFFETIGFFWILAVVIGPILKRVRDELIENLKEEQEHSAKTKDRSIDAEDKRPDVLREFLKSLDLDLEEPSQREPLQGPPPPPPILKPKAEKKVQAKAKFQFKSSFEKKEGGLSEHHLETSISKNDSIVSERFQNQNVYKEYEKPTKDETSRVEELINEQENLSNSIYFHAILAKPKAFKN